MGPGKFLPLCVIGFGLCSLCTAFVTSYGGLIAVRFFLGVTEAGLFPGAQIHELISSITDSNQGLSYYLRSVELFSCCISVAYSW